MSSAIATEKNAASVKEQKNSFKIAVLEGDGTGPEVVREGLKILNAAARKFKFKLDFVNYDLGGERYKKNGEILPESVLSELRKVDSIFLQIQKVHTVARHWSKGRPKATEKILNTHCYHHGFHEQQQ